MGRRHPKQKEIVNRLYYNILTQKQLSKKCCHTYSKQIEITIFARYFMMVKRFLFILIIGITTITNAQINEIGVFVGGSNYIGDIGSTDYVNPNDYAFGVIYKYNLNPRIALRGAFTYAKISADDSNSKNIARQQRDLNFSNTIKELAVGVEFNYFEYDLSTIGKSQTPYILLEVAVYNYNIAKYQTAPNEYQYGNKTFLSIPFGLGYKAKIVGNLAGAIEVGVRYTFTDELDYNNEIINALSFGNPNSNDWYVFTGINLVYTFGRPACYATR